MKKAIVNQGAFTSVVEIKKDDVCALHEKLKQIGDNVDLADCPIDFNQLTTVHFLRLVILDETKSHDIQYASPPCLVLSTNYDLSLTDHLNDLIKVGGPTLRDIYSHCQDFDPKGTDLSAYLRQHAVESAAFYVGTRGRTVQEIEDENRLRDAIQEFLDQPGYDRTKDPLAIRGDIQKHVLSKPGFEWVKDNQRSKWQWWLFFYGTPVAVIILIVFLLLAACGVIAGWFGLPYWVIIVGSVLAGIAGALLLVGAGLRLVIWKENQEARRPPPTVPIMGARISELVKREDQIVQNQLSNIVWIKPGWIRLTTVRLVLSVVNLLGRYWYVRGELGGIPTIHFARWVILKDSRRLIFLSNFDGSWENYLGDFIDKAAPGLTSIWSNCIGCPPAHGLLHDGARDEPHFKSWTRENQLVTQVWYSKYEELSVVNINNNSFIRLGLLGDSNVADTRQWLARL